MININFQGLDEVNLGPLYKTTTVLTQGQDVVINIPEKYKDKITRVYVIFKVGDIKVERDLAFKGDNIYNMPIPKDILIEGNHKMEFIITSSNGAKIVSRNYVFTVVPGLGTEESI